MPTVRQEPLPVFEVLPQLRAALRDHAGAVLEAPPGAGKSTGVPLALLGEAWLAGRRILMLEPRRLAARAVATRMAQTLGEPVGATVGYRIRMESRVGRDTRIEVVTEGMLTRQLQHDPALEGVGLLIFDEFHERNLQADLGLALALDAQRHLNTGLRILVMSATLDGAAVAKLLGDAPRITAAGRAFPVETSYVERPSQDRIEQQAARAVLRVLREESGNTLVFLPGAGEIRRVRDALGAAELPPGTRLLPLYGDLGAAEQDEAIAPARPGQRKVVLATNIAETSLTIEGIRVVIDSGLERRPRFDPATGMDRLETVRISVGSADQRRGRAGRLGPGVCVRLWTAAVQRSLSPHAPPEIAAADLASLALELACWGAEPTSLRWLDPPPAAACGQARDLLARLGALDGAGRVTAHGREMAAIGAHPRLAHLLLAGRGMGEAGTACALAALLTERDVLRGNAAERDADLRTRIELLAGSAAPAGQDADRGTLARVRRTADLFARQLGARGPLHAEATGALLAAAYPDRIARSRPPGSGRYQLATGRGAFFAGVQSLAKAEYLVIASLDAGERDARIFLAAPISLREIDAQLGQRIKVQEDVAWDEREGAIIARRARLLDDLVLEELPAAKPDPDTVRRVMLDAIRRIGIGALPWTDALRAWQARVLFARRHDPHPTAAWPDVSEAALLASLDTWLGPFLDGVSRRSHLARVDLAAALRALLDWQQGKRLEELAPTHLAVPSGSRIAIDYLDGEIPSLSVRLQEVFGLRETPRLCEGRVPVMMKLLSPARRPVQVTRDLESFWQRGYHEVKKELKGRYPKHYWPEDPYQAEPTRRARPR